MKKFSALIALMLCVTIGGVYAAWTYAGTNDIADVFAESKITITDIEYSGAAGVYKIESNLVLTIDQANDKHEAKLVFDSNNDQPIYLTVTFTPSKDADKAIKESAVPTELYWGTTTTMQYKIDAGGNYSETGTPVDILKFNNVANNILDNYIEWTRSETANSYGAYTFTYTMDQTDLETAIQLNETFVLDTKSEHDAFRAALSGNIVARVSDGTIDGETLPAAPQQ